jgi:uncharacterized membrane protein
MHLIPQSAAHLHILVSVFPSFGLVILLGFYLAGFVTANEGIRRTCLVLFGLLALLAIPTYLSGQGSVSAVSGNAKVPKGLIDFHYWWGLAALVVLVITGIAAWVDLFRSGRAGSATDAKRSFFVVSGLAVVSLVLMMVADGWEINHSELQVTIVIPDVSTAPIWPHVHMILNHVPTVGFVFALAFFVIALATNNDVMKQASLVLFVISSVVGIPTYVTGTATMWALTQPVIPEISRAVINAHREMALWSLFGMAFTGAAAWIELWRYRYFSRFSMLSLTLVLVFAVVTLAIMAETGHRGGQINHPEIHVASEIVPTETEGTSTAVEERMKSMVWFLPWQIAHYFGYCLIFGSVFAVVLRVLGFWKSVSFAAVHRLLLLGFLGVLINVFSGMLMMLRDSYRYVVGDYAFGPKIAFITIGAIAVLYFSLSTRVWSLKAGEDAPVAAKLVAAFVLLAWTGVLVGGRMLAFL